MRLGTFSAHDLKPLGYSTLELRLAGFGAAELRELFTLEELRAGVYVYAQGVALKNQVGTPHPALILMRVCSCGSCR